LKIESETNDFGQVPVGSHVTRTFTVANTGGTTVTVTKSKPPSEGAFTATTSLPEGTTIAPGESLTEQVVFAPTALGTAEGVWVINGTGTSGLREVHFSGAGTTVPAVETGAASSIAQTSATLNATVNPNGEAVSDCHFEYGKTTSYGSSVPCTKLPGSGSGLVGVSASIEALAPDTAYYFRIVVTNPTGTSYGAAVSLTTKPAAPAVETGAASSIAQTSATLNGTVNPNGEAVSDCRFEYGTTAAYGSSVPCTPLPGSGSGAIEVSAAIGGLATGTTYDYRIVAGNSVGASYGAGATLTTLAPPSLGPLTGVLPDLESLVAPALPDAVLGSTALTANSSGTITVRVGCPEDVTNCAGTVTLRTLTAVIAKHRQAKKSILTLATSSFAVAGGRATSVKLHLSSKARAVLARLHRLRANVTIAAHDTAGITHTTHAVVTIRLVVPKRHS
ncbi:MAG: DUF1573 domain-containing protein, partial [Solirubrobacteraceae bacterium]